MSVQCMRPGCAGAAAVRLVFDAVGCEVWLDELADTPVDTSTQAQLLCAHHGARLGVPRGWTVVDRRSPLVAAEVARTETAQPRADRPVPGGPPEAVPSPPEAVLSPPEAVLSPPEAVPAPDRPETDPASGSLLGRAFAWAGPQRSAITERPGADEEDADAPEAGDTSSSTDR